MKYKRLEGVLRGAHRDGPYVKTERFFYITGTAYYSWNVQPVKVLTFVYDTYKNTGFRVAVSHT